MLDRLPRPVFFLLLLALLAQGLAFGTNAIFARKFAVSPDRLASAARPSASAGGEAGEGDNTSLEGAGSTPAESRRKPNLTRSRSWFEQPIVRRNLFDSANALAGKKDEPTANPEGEAQKSDLDIVLIATSAASDPSWSTAMMSVSKGLPTLFYMSDVVLNAEIVEIHNPWLDTVSEHHPGRVVFLRDGQLEYLDIGGTPKAGARRKGGSKTAKKDKKKRGGRHKWDGITDLGGGKYSVEQGEIDYAMANLDKLSREARVVPNFQDGSPNGFKVFSIRRTSALRKMGLKNNDVLTSVNGFDLSNTQKALEIYSKLQSDKNFTLEILRNGEPMTMEYSVQ